MLTRADLDDLVQAIQAAVNAGDWSTFQDLHARFFAAAVAA